MIKADLEKTDLFAVVGASETSDDFVSILGVEFWEGGGFHLFDLAFNALTPYEHI